MRKVRLLDTNHMSVAIRRESTFRDRLYQAHRAGVRLRTCMPVVCELEAGVFNTHRADACRHTLDVVLKRVRLWPVNRQVARTYGEIYIETRRRGRPMTHVDIVLAALARLTNATLLTTDRDFEALPDIRTENWLNDDDLASPP